MSKNYLPKKLLAFVGFALVIPPVLIQLGWIRLSDEKMLIYVSLAFCIAAIICCSKSFNQPVIYLRIATVVIVLVASFIGLMNVFQLF